jgi:uncharacterized protein (TIGR02271 family)
VEIRCIYRRRKHMIDRNEVLQSRGSTVVGSDGQKVGSVEDIYLDRETEEPEWALVKTGLFGSRGTFVPLAEATMQGSDVTVPYGKDQVKSAPNIDPDGELSQEQEVELYNYYGLAYSDDSSDTGLPQGRGGDEWDEGTIGRDTSGPTTDDAMTRSEEELRIGKAKREAGTARLKKYVVTENVTQTVPLQREEVRVEREPISDANVDKATSGPDISDEEHEVVLHEEEPVTEKRTVPKERVRLSTDTVTDEREVSEEVRKEQIEAEGDVRR